MVESGMSARGEYQRAWRARRKAAGIPTHSAERLLKQSAWLSATYHRLRCDLFEIVGKSCTECRCEDTRVLEFDHIFGKKRAGRELDGREWNEFPQVGRDGLND